MLDKATEEADLSSVRQRIGCVITNKHGRIISKGHNMMKTHPMQKRYAVKAGNEEAIYLHAEISALVKCREDPHTIYISRRMRNGSTGLAKPCPICQMAIEEAGIKNIVYTK